MTAGNTEVAASASDVPAQKFELDHDIYHEVSCSAQLSEIRLVGSKYAVKLELFEQFEKVADMSHKYMGRCEELFIDDNEGNAGGRFSWIAEIKSGRKQSLKLSADYFLLYSGVGGLDEDHVCFFVTKVGRFATYPYFRSLFANHVSESGLILPPLPTLNERVD